MTAKEAIHDLERKEGQIVYYKTDENQTILQGAPVFVRAAT